MFNINDFAYYIYSPNKSVQYVGCTTLLYPLVSDRDYVFSSTENTWYYVNHSKALCTIEFNPITEADVPKWILVEQLMYVS